MHDRRPQRGQARSVEQRRRMVWRVAESHEVEHDVGLVDGTVIEYLEHGDGVDAAAESRHRQGDDIVSPAGINATVEETCAALLARRRNEIDGLLVGSGWITHRHQ